jgi:hypothetical protein
MAQQGIKNWVVRAVAPDGKTVRYFMVGNNNAADAKTRVANLLKGRGQSDWLIEEPVVPELL